MWKNNGNVETVIRSEHRSDGENSYYYELSVQQSGRTASYRVPLYSINVRMTDSEGAVTTAKMRDVFADAGKALVFFDRVVNGLATPIDLAYIVEDEVRK